MSASGLGRGFFARGGSDQAFVVSCMGRRSPLIVCLTLLIVVIVLAAVVRPGGENALPTVASKAFVLLSPATKSPTMMPTSMPTTLAPVAYPLPRVTITIRDVCSLEASSLQPSQKRGTAASGELVKRDIFNLAQDCLKNSPWVPSKPMPVLCDRDFSPAIDLQQHFEEILNATTMWRDLPPIKYAEYEGPWLEDYWISEFCCNKSVQEDFGGLVPLFIRWSGTNGHHAKEGAERIASLLRDDVIYVTYSQPSGGMFFKAAEKLLSPKQVWNVLVFSGAGFGHIPVPLLIRELPMEPPLIIDQRRFLFGFVGGMHPWSGARRVMKDVIKRTSQRLNYPGMSGDSPQWKSIMNQTMFSIAPRGYGRTSFRLFEIIQMGRGLPVYLWDDEPWIPYENTEADVRNFGYSMHVNDFEQFIVNMTTSLAIDPAAHIEFYARQEKMRKLREDYFTYQGVLRQIRYFFSGDSRGRLKCARHPLRASVFGLWPP